MLSSNYKPCSCRKTKPNPPTSSTDHSTFSWEKGLRLSTNYPNAYITKEYPKAIPLETKELIRAMIMARKKV